MKNGNTRLQGSNDIIKKEFSFFRDVLVNFLWLLLLLIWWLLKEPFVLNEKQLQCNYARSPLIRRAN